MQCAVVVAMLVFLALRPPPVGAMLVISLRGASQGDLLNVALRRGGILLGAGPLRRSLIVYGDRALLQPAFWRAGAIMVAAPAFACGDLNVQGPRGTAA